MRWRSEQRPDTHEKAVILGATNSLARHLERELYHLAGEHRSADGLKEVYNTLYRPAICALVDGLNLFVVHPDGDLFRQSFCPALADTQLRLILERLYSVEYMFRDG